MSDNPISIVMFSNLFPPVASGSSTACSELARELVKRGHKVVVIASQVDPQSNSYEVLEGVHIYRLPSLRLPKMDISLHFPWLTFTFTPANQKRIREIVEKHRPQIIHLHNHMFDTAFSAVLTARKFHLPLVITIHTIIKHANRLYNLILFPADRLFLKMVVIDKAKVLICPDITIEKYVWEAFHKVNVAIVPYGIVPPPKADPESIETIKEKYRLNGKRVILSLGHVHDIRNRRDLVEAMPNIREVFPDTVLLIVGTVGTNQTKAIAQRLNVEDFVIFTGAIPHTQIPAFLALSEIEAHWLNQDDVENTTLGIASLESMAAGKAIISTANKNAYGEGILRNGENLILVSPGEPDQLAQVIISLLSDNTKRNVIGGRARETIKQNFSWESVCDKTIQVYRRVLTQ